MNFQKILLSCIFLICSISILFSQSYSDGPISVDVKLREVQGNFAPTDEALLGIGFAPDELVFKIWAQDNLLTYSWTGGTCLQDNNFNPTPGGANSIDFNTTFANFSFPTTVVPQYLDFKVDTWEDDIPSDGLSLLGVGFCQNGTACTWEDVVCCGVSLPFNLGCGGIETGDDYRCDANPFYQGLTYRSGPPCQWYSHGYLNSSGCSNSSINGYYKPHIETFWRYTKGTSFFHAIDLGSVNSGTSISHFNSNECYTDYYPSSTGNDVIYSFNVVNPIGVNISLCGMNGAQFDSYLYLVKDTNLIALSENNDHCGSQSQITTSLCNSGTYYVVVDATSPSELGTFILEINEDPGSSFSVVDSISDYNGAEISCVGGNDGKFYAHINGGTPPYTYTWTGPNGFTATTNDSITGLSAGNYSVIVTDSKNCILPTLSITLNDPLPIVVTTNPTSPLCNGGVDGAITVTNTSGGISTLPYSYSWNTTPTPQSGISAISLSAGTYTLTVTDANGCSITHLETITDPAAPSMNISSTNLPVNNNPLTYQVCDGNDITLIASPGFSSYSWSPNIWLIANSGSTVTSSPNSGIIYTCTGTDALGCTTDIPVIIDVVSSVSMYASDPSPQVCEGEDIEVIWYGDPGTNFAWNPPIYLSSPSSISGQPITINPLDTITYTVTAQNASGCTDETKFFVDILPAPNIINATPLTPNSVCYGSSVPITASGANSYSWYPYSTLNNNFGSVVTSSPLSTTTYWVVGTALNGCKDSIDITIDVNPLPVLNVIGTNNICEGESTSLLVSGANSYIWTPSTSLNTSVGNLVLASPSTSQTYIITGTDINQCVGTISYSVSVLPAPNISVIATEDTICIGNSSNLTAIGASSYIWNPSSSLNVSISPVVSATPITTTTYSVLGTDANNCSSSSSIIINVNPLPILNATPNSSTICEGDSVVVTASGAQDFIWSPALGLNTSIGNSVVASPNITTDYTITGTDTNGCLDVISALVNVNQQPIITLSSVPNTHDICEGSSVNINAFGALSYSWSPSFGLNSTTAQSVIANPNTSTYYTVIGTDINSCTNIANFQLNVGINPTVSISANNPIICEGQSISLLADGANQYVWIPSNTLSSGVGTVVIATPLISTEYILVGTDILGCKDTTSFVVSVNPLPTANIVSGGGILCSGDSAAIIVDVSGNPSWNITYSVDGAVNSVVSSTNPTIILSTQEGVYTIPYVSDANGCSNVGSGTEYVDVVNNPQANIDYNPENPDMLNPQVSFINNSIFSSTYLWQFGDNTPYSLEFNPVHTYQEDGTYTVVLLAENGPCVDTAFIDIVIDPYYALYVPNTFGPNGDGRNDNFEPQGVGIESFEIYIYNRWGDEVFYSDNFDIFWDGGEGIAGTYTYIISVVDKIGVFHKKNGFILIE